tara:strand:+ start:132 stop:320 length:189 start_codon:yes stop_codon:yes gene_type:complete
MKKSIRNRNEVFVLDIAHAYAKYKWSQEEGESDESFKVRTIVEFLSNWDQIKELIDFLEFTY